MEMTMAVAAKQKIAPKTLAEQAVDLKAELESVHERVSALMDQYVDLHMVPGVPRVSVAGTIWSRSFGGLNRVAALDLISNDQSFRACEHEK
jgi:hypothetical protein